MKLAISYFYRIRFFDSSMVPLSTAMWDPKWFSQNSSVYADKNGVINGLKFQPFVPGDGCNQLCRGAVDCNSSPDTCAFLKKYREQLDALSFEDTIGSLQNIAANLKTVLSLVEDPTLVLMVYEPPYKPCSERVPLRAWFRDHGHELPEV